MTFEQKQLEKRIDSIGRDKVFAAAHAYGWSGGAIAMWMWSEL